MENLCKIYYYEVFRQVEDAKTAFNAARKTKSTEHADGSSDYTVIEEGMYPEEATAEQKGIAFARALAYALDGDDEMDRFFQDLFSILEDKVVSTADAEQAEWAEDAERAYQIEAIKKILDRDPDGEYNSDYIGDLSKHEAARVAFAERKADEIKAKMAEHDEKAKGV